MSANFYTGYAVDKPTSKVMVRKLTFIIFKLSA